MSSKFTRKKVSVQAGKPFWRGHYTLRTNATSYTEGGSGVPSNRLRRRWPSIRLRGIPMDYSNRGLQNSPLIAHPSCSCRTPAELHRLSQAACDAKALYALATATSGVNCDLGSRDALMENEYDLVVGETAPPIPIRSSDGIGGGGSVLVAARLLELDLYLLHGRASALDAINCDLSRQRRLKAHR